MFKQKPLTHPYSVDESDEAHSVFAGRFAMRVFAVSNAATAYAIIPSLLDNTAGHLIPQRHAEMHNRGH